MSEPRTHCIRCGTCCEKGGPALHGEDLDKVLGKQIPPEKLYTLRIGELVYDNVNGGLMVTDEELVKVKSVEEGSGCAFYDPVKKDCRIYELRPFECRIMNCWDTAAAENFYVVDRLDRAAIFEKISWLMDLLETHEEKCGYGRMHQLCQQRQSGDAMAGQAILEAVHYDLRIRQVVEEKTGMAAEMMDLIFGRPLEKTLPVQFGIKLTKIADRPQGAQ